VPFCMANEDGREVEKTSSYFLEGRKGVKGREYLVQPTPPEVGRGGRGKKHLPYHSFASRNRGGKREEKGPRPAVMKNLKKKGERERRTKSPLLLLRAGRGGVGKKGGGGGEGGPPASFPI